MRHAFSHLFSALRKEARRRRGGRGEKALSYRADALPWYGSTRRLGSKSPKSGGIGVNCTNPADIVKFVKFTGLARG